MDFGDSFSADWPAPRDDEPPGLRQDILDELADHLACSYNRELLRGANPGEARRRAIERFGDPAAVARRLWLDAMRGKIMAQRVLIATCLVVMAACIGIVGLVWNQANRAAAEANRAAAAVADANRHLAEVLGQTQSTNQEMLRHLQAMAKPAQPAKSDDWIPVQFVLKMDDPGGPPAVGYKVILGRGRNGTNKDEAIHRSTDVNGLADFGVVQPGDWEFSIHAGPWHSTGGLNVIPGRSIVKQIVCPKAPPDPVQVKVRLNWPKPLPDKDIVVVAWFYLQNKIFQPPLEWNTTNSVQLVGRPGGGFTVLDQVLTLNAEKPDLTSDPNQLSKVSLDRLLAQGKIHGVVPLDSSTLEDGPVEVGAGRYSLAQLMLFRYPPTGRDTTAVDSELLTMMTRPGEQGIQVKLSGNRIGVIHFLQGHLMKSSSRNRYDRFEAGPGQSAEWVIPLSDEMIRDAEKRLKPEAPAGKTG